MEPESLLTMGPPCQPSMASPGLLHEREMQSASFKPLLGRAFCYEQPDPSLVRLLPSQARPSQTCEKLARHQDGFSECEP